MRLHSDTLSSADLTAAIADAGLGREGVWVDARTPHGSQSRDHAFEVRLAARIGRDRNGKARRPRNSGSYGARFEIDVRAATYDEWGYWMAAIFDRDPRAIFAGAYAGREDFHRKTGGRFPTPAARAALGNRIGWEPARNA